MVARAYSVVVLGMLAMPFLIAAAIGFFLWRGSRRPPAPSTPPPPPPSA